MEGEICLIIKAPLCHHSGPQNFAESGAGLEYHGLVEPYMVESKAESKSTHKVDGSSSNLFTFGKLVL